MSIGTRSVLFGAHCFFIHPWFVAWAWWQLYGFPLDPRLWFAFFVHDLGYIGKPNMDGPEGEEHPWFAARLMWRLFDHQFVWDEWTDRIHWRPKGSRWMDFCLAHSRYLAKRYGLQPSRLCFADKLAFVLTPRWLYLPSVVASGEIHEYLKMAQTADSGHWTPTGFDRKAWHSQLCRYMRDWVAAHKDGSVDTWTNADRHTRAARGAQ